MASQRAWLEKELERVLQEKQTMAALEKVGGGGWGDCRTEV